MPVRTEISLRLPNSPGALRDVALALAADGVHVLAFSLEGTGLLRLVVDNVTRAEGVLRDRRRSPTSRPVLVVSAPAERGALGTIFDLVAEAGVNIDYAYSARSGTDGVMLVMGVPEPVRVATATGL
jgi:hypothetical protein